MTITSGTFRTVHNASGDWLCIKCSHPERVLEGMKPGVYDVDIKPHRERRSLDANAYFWVLADKLADKLTVPKIRPVSKEEIYRSLIPDVPGVSTVLCVQDKAVDTFCKSWEQKGCGWLTEQEPSKIPGCTNVTAYYGSSVYDTKQMSRLLDLLIAECKRQGVETLTPQELARLEGYDGY